MEALLDIPLDLDEAALMAAAHVPPDSEDAQDFRQLVETARQVGRPKAVYRECRVEVAGPETVRLEGVPFTSRALRVQLEAAERVFAFIATCGREMETAAPPAGDFLAGFWWDTIQAALLGCAGRYLAEHLSGRYGLAHTATLSPGAGDAAVWPIRQQRELFRLLGEGSARIGVALADSFLMLPRKSVSGVHFPSGADCAACRLCHRVDCPSRRAPFDPALWEASAGPAG